MANAETSNNTTQQNFIKMMKHFSTRVVQAVVQSRMGDDYKVSHPCSVRNDNSVWFNLVIDEIGEIAAHLKQKMEKYSPITHTLFLEFTLHTAEGDYLPLEFWVIWIDNSYTDENADIKAIVYSQLSTLLKSVIMAARFTPTYRHYVSKQHLDTYVILYKVSFGEPDYSILGEERKFKQLGTLPTPYGAIRMDLHYRTNMVILPALVEIETTQPKPIIKDFGEQNKQYCDIYGNVVPAKGSTIVSSSPALTDYNCFSTSPLSSDFPFVESDDEDETKDLPSIMAEETYESRAQRNLSGGSNKSNSPKGTSSSFLQKTRQQRTRNNSFPFSSLLMDSMSDHTKSQILPKVPENAPVSSTLHQSSSERILNRKIRSNFHSKRRSLTSEPPSTLPLLEHHEETVEEKSKSAEIIKENEKLDEDKDFFTKKKVVFGCSVNETNEYTDINEKNDKNNIIEKNEFDDERESCSSDDSYVKVIAFASSDNIYSDLTDFAQEVHSAPKNLASCITESTDELTKQIDEFRERASIFDDFVAGLKEMDELG